MKEAVWKIIISLHVLIIFLIALTKKTKVRGKSFCLIEWLHVSFCYNEFEYDKLLETPGPLINKTHSHNDIIFRDISLNYM